MPSARRNVLWNYIVDTTQNHKQVSQCTFCDAIFTKQIRNVRTHFKHCAKLDNFNDAKCPSFSKSLIFSARILDTL